MFNQGINIRELRITESTLIDRIKVINQVMVPGITWFNSSLIKLELD